MREFKDINGRPWRVGITVAELKRVRALLGLDLANILGEIGKPADTATPPLLARLADDPTLLCDLLYVVCQPQATSEGVTDEQFGQAMGGDALSDGTDALLGALVDFFRSLKRPEKARAVETMRALILAGAEAADKLMAKADVGKAIASIVGSSSMNAPGSAASTPPPSPSASSSG